MAALVLSGAPAWRQQAPPRSGRLLREREAYCALDLERPLDRRARHHALVMSCKTGEVAGGGVLRVDEAPKEAKEMDVGDRIALDRPLPSPQPTLGDAEHLPPALDTDAAGRMNCRGDERHPRQHLRLGLETALRPQAGR